MDELILVSYLQGEATEEECRKVEEWCDASPENRRRLEQMYYTLFVGDRLAIMNAVDTESSLQQLKARIRKKERGSRKVVWKRFATIAAAFLAGILVTGSVVWGVYAGKVSAYTVCTEPGQRARVVLPDGSKVWLNSSTSLDYQTSFWNSDRLVHLKGEAYFEVAPDEHAPFIVNSKDIKTCVLGTKFNVRAREEEDRVVTTLLQGSVRMDAPQTKGKGVQLKPGQTLDMNVHTYKAELIEYTRPDEILLWIKGKLRFDQVSLRDITLSLEKHYNVRFVYEDEDLKDERFTCEFKTDDALASILSVLVATKRFSYKKEGRIVKLYKE